MWNKEELRVLLNTDWSSYAEVGQHWKQYLVRLASERGKLNYMLGPISTGKGSLADRITRYRLSWLFLSEFMGFAMPNNIALQIPLSRVDAKTNYPDPKARSASIVADLYVPGFEAVQEMGCWQTFYGMEGWRDSKGASDEDSWARSNGVYREDFAADMSAVAKFQFGMKPEYFQLPPEVFDVNNTTVG